MSPPDAGRLERNLRLFVVHEALAHFYPWLPIFVLFTRGAFGLDGALTLASVHYLAVVVAEVPSGWLSDRVGRVPTLRITALTWIGAHSLFLAADDRFWMVLLAQVLSASGFAALSGTNVSFHFDTLEALDRSGEYEWRQGRAAAVAYASMAAGALAGGLLGLVDVRAGFPIALAMALVQLAVVSGFTEPPSITSAPALLPQISACARYLASPFLAWVLFYWIAMVVLEHLAFTMAQPYLTEVLGNTADAVGETPIVAGLQFAGFNLLGALAVRWATAGRLRLGFFAIVMAIATLSALVVSAMAIWLSAWVIGVMLFRSVQGAVGGVVLTAALAPLVAKHQRATYLSLHSLAGRLVYGSILFLTARIVGDDLDATLDLFAGIAWALVASLAAVLVLVPRVRRVPGIEVI